MSLYKTYKTDSTLEKEGIWLEYGLASNGEPIRIKIARAGGQNTRYVKALEKATKPYKKMLQAETLDNETAENIQQKVFAETVVLDWKNVEGDNGELMEFNVGNVLKLFSDLPDLFIDIRQAAQQLALFREDVLEGDLKNSGRSLNTDSSKGRSKEK